MKAAAIEVLISLSMAVGISTLILIHAIAIIKIWMIIIERCKKAIEVQTNYKEGKETIDKVMKIVVATKHNHPTSSTMKAKLIAELCMELQVESVVYEETAGKELIVEISTK